MKTLYLLLALILVIGCASSSQNEKQQEQYPHLIKLIPPEGQSNQPSKVYIDSVKQIVSKETPALLISGSLPDACTHIKDISHKVQDDLLKIDISAWRNPDHMCAQVLTPFSVIYDGVTEKEISAHSKAQINDSVYNF